MQINFWNQRWDENQTGFHLPFINPYIEKYWPELNIQPGTHPEVNVFIPLCGKSLDISWFASRQYNVLGVECSAKAVESYFSEQNLTPSIEKSDNFNIYKHENINLLQGDFFQLTKDKLSSIDAVYDRASLVALPEEMRKQYIKLLTDALPGTVSIMLVTLEYDQTRMSGPPFSVSNDEIQHHYQKHFNIELLMEHDVLEQQPRFKAKGLNYMVERIYKITR